MGLLGRILGRGTPRPDQVAAGWEPDGLGVVIVNDDDDSSAEDGAILQFGLANDGLPGCAILIAFYPVERSPGVWVVERRITWLIADPSDDPHDPQQAPWFEHSEYDTVSDASLYSEDAALTMACQWASDDVPLAAEDYGTWDGEPFEEG
jgi:hypothetical protein